MKYKTSSSLAPKLFIMCYIHIGEKTRKGIVTIPWLWTMRLSAIFPLLLFLSHFLTSVQKCVLLQTRKETINTLQIISILQMIGNQ